MGFHFHQNVGVFIVITVNAVLIREEASRFGTFHHRSVVFIRGKHKIRSFLKGIFDHFEQGFILFFAIDNPVGIENFVAAMFRVGLREHIKLNVVRIASKCGEIFHQIIDFIFRQCQAQLHVGTF